ncbi:MAG: alkaline phosphatase family protein [Phycisphaerae bacterium]
MRSEKGLLAGLALLAAGCQPAVVRLSASVERPRQALVFFFVDGLDRARFDQMLADGELPRIRRLFIDGGVQVRDAVACLPPVTYPNCVSLITGLLPGHHGIMGNYWFDRRTLEAHYYMRIDTYLTVNDHFTAPTLYDALPEAFTLNLQNHTRRGVSRTIDNREAFAMNWFLGRYVEVDAMVGRSINDVVACANRAGSWPRILMTYYPGVDEVGHRHGADSPEYAAALRNIDAAVGRIADRLAAEGLASSIYYCLLADHSHCPILPARHLDLLKWLTDCRGLTILSEPMPRPEEYARWRRRMERYTAVAAVDAGRIVMVHLPGRHGWPDRPPERELIEWITAKPSLLELPAVEMAAIRAGPDRARVMSSAGTAIVERRIEAGRKLYRVAESSGDVLRAGESAFAAFIRQGWHESRAWLAASARERYPDFVPQVVELFDSPRTGDVVVMAAEEWGFAFGPAENGGHGSCVARDMHVPLLFAGPDLPRGAVVPHARLVDVMPTVLGLLGEAHRLDRLPAIDGVNIADELRAAR